MRKSRRLALIVCACMFTFAGVTAAAGKADFLSSVKPLYAAGQFDGAIAFCQGVSTFEANLVCYLCYLEKYGRSYQRQDRDQANMYKGRAEGAATLNHAAAIAELASVDHHKRGRKGALYLLKDVLAAARTPDDVLAMVCLLEPQKGSEANRLALQYIYKHLNSVRKRIQRGGTMTATEKALFSNGALINSLVQLLENRRTGWTAEKCLVQIHEPAIQRLHAATPGRRMAQATAKVDRAIQWRIAKRPSSTWFSAYGQEPVAASSKPRLVASSPVATGTGKPEAAAVVAASTGGAPAVGTMSDRSGRRRFSGGLGALAGDSTYQIGGTVTYSDGSGTQMHFPISELIFPLDVVMLNLRYSVELSDPWSMELELGKNITTDAGSMKDSDWITPGVLAIYSESDTELNALILNAGVKRRISERDRLDISLGGGLKYESFEFECANVVQTSILPGYSGSSSGLVLTYDLTYIMPYAEISADYEMSDKMKVSASLGYSPLVMVEDQDSHLARSPQKFSDGTYDGTAVLLSVSARYLMDNGWFLQGNIDTVTIEADGEQDARSGASSWTIDAEIESSQTMISAAMGRFL